MDKSVRAESLRQDLISLGEVTIKAMFGGYGLFESGVMFAIVDRDGTAFLRAVPETEPRYVAAGSHKHGMPYWSVPDDVLADGASLLEWAGEALEAARAAKKK
ncbi:MAG: TfoX/Sxy family protein [Acidimicrobiia bacterium]|jgi:DNA transformation protein|nr:TfoX/Sxy family protein [Acidimicrobiia bacterium]